MIQKLYRKKLEAIVLLLCIPSLILQAGCCVSVPATRVAVCRQADGSIRTSDPKECCMGEGDSPGECLFHLNFCDPGLRDCSDTDFFGSDSRPCALSITGLEPDHAFQGDNFLLDISTGFDDPLTDAIVHFSPPDGIVINDTRISSSSVEVRGKISFTAAPGVRQVSISTLFGSSNSLPFNILPLSSVANIDCISPSSADSPDPGQPP